jgi:hypothetical protein
VEIGTKLVSAHFTLTFFTTFVWEGKGIRVSACKALAGRQIGSVQTK